MLDYPYVFTSLNVAIGVARVIECVRNYSYVSASFDVTLGIASKIVDVLNLSYVFTSLEIGRASCRERVCLSV